MEFVYFCLLLVTIHILISPKAMQSVNGWNEVDVEGVEPMTSVTPQVLKQRDDVVRDGGQQAKILANAPDAREGFFAVPKVVE